jgi:hypothetical protein
MREMDWVVSVSEESGLCDGSGDDRESESVSKLLVRPEHRAASISSIFSYAGCIDREKMKEASMSPWRTPSWDSMVPLYSPF